MSSASRPSPIPASTNPRTAAQKPIGGSKPSVNIDDPLWMNASLKPTPSTATKISVKPVRTRIIQRMTSTNIAIGP